MDKIEIFDAIKAERARQDRLKSEGRFPATCADPISNLRKLAVLAEEFGEIARIVNDLEDRKISYATARQDLIEELTQTAAVCVAWLESL